MTLRHSVLFLVGSSTTAEMQELSELYARGAMEALGPHHDLGVLHHAPDGSWRHGRTLGAAKAGRPLTLAQAVAAVSEARYDVALPQMFCPFGMTAGRALLELMDLPFVGNTPDAMALTVDKAKARAVAAAAGLNVPEGCVASRGCVPEDLPAFPVIVKPVAGDNSEGLSLVEHPDALFAALARVDGEALIERFIPPGRELRCGVIERNGALLCLPPEEYPVGGERPIRTKSDKLARTDTGALMLAAKTQEAAWIVEPDDPATPALHEAALQAYRALGCRHYGLFDFRVDDAGTPWFLEAGLYCSFSPQSVVAVMAEAAGIPLPALFAELARAATGHDLSPTRTVA